MVGHDVAESHHMAGHDDRISAHVPQLPISPPRPATMARLSKVADVPLLRGRAPPKRPPALASHGVTEDQFDGWMKLIEETQLDGNAFARCPCIGMCYWCCPLLCFQPVLCMANPCTWYMTIRDARSRDATEDRIRHETPDSLHFKWTLFQHAVWEQETLFELRLQQPGIHPDPPPATIPARLQAVGATQEQWARWCELLQRERRAHLLHGCASPYVSFAYSFFPFGGFQPCICVLNPATWWSARNVHRARKEAEASINGDLAQCGCHFRFEPSGRAAIFARGPPSPSKRKKGGVVTVVLQGGGFGLPVPGTARTMLPSADDNADLAHSPPPHPVRV
jgi:hypothetical protein